MSLYAFLRESIVDSILGPVNTDESLNWYFENSKHQVSATLPCGDRLIMTPQVDQRWKVSRYRDGKLVNHMYIQALDVSDATDMFWEIMDAAQNLYDTDPVLYNSHAPTGVTVHLGWLGSLSNQLPSLVAA